MSKSSFFTGQPIFTQLLCFIPRNLVQRMSRKHNADRYVKSFGAYEHLVTLLYATFNRCSSLREVISGLQACSSRLLHLGLKSTPRRATLADANKRRGEAFFEDLYHELYRHHFGALPDSFPKRNWLDRLYIIDSTTISLFSEVMQGAGCFGLNGRKKGGIKAHLCARAAHNVGAFVHLSHGKANDNSFLPKVHLPAGSIVVFDKGYRNYEKLAQWSQAAITWVSRINARSVYRTVEQRPVSPADTAKGVIADNLIDLGNPATAARIPIMTARLIVYRDPITGKQLEFITNSMRFSPATIAAIYKKRWQIELMFKRIKGAFQLHFFMGESENAIRIQLWCALIADLLLQVVKSKLKLRAKRSWSDAGLAAIMRLHLITYINLFHFLHNPEKALLAYKHPPPKQQLNLFKI